MPLLYTPHPFPSASLLDYLMPCPEAAQLEQIATFLAGTKAPDSLLKNSIHITSIIMPARP
jgi:hypothetical protein